MIRLLFIGCVLLGHFSLQAQDLQRLVLPAQKIEMAAGSGKNNINPVRSFCVDFNRYSNFDGTDDYSHLAIDALCVKFGNSAQMTLQEALDEGKLRMDVKHYNNIRFTNLTNKPVVIDIRDHLVLGKNGSDVDGLVIPKGLNNVGGDTKARQERVWITQSLIYLGFLDEGAMDNADAIRAAKKAYFNSVWGKDLDQYGIRKKYVAGTMTNDEFKRQMQDDAEVLQYALASGDVSPVDKAKIGREAIEKAWPIRRHALFLRLEQPRSRYWTTDYLLYKDYKGEYFLFSRDIKLLLRATDERDLSAFLLKNNAGAQSLKISSLGEFNTLQEDALGASIELQLKAGSMDCQVTVESLTSLHSNQDVAEAILDEKASHKLKSNLQNENIKEDGGKSSGEAEFISTDRSGKEYDVVIGATSDQRSGIVGFFGWAKEKFSQAYIGSLYGAIRRYCLKNRIATYVKSMTPYLRITRKIETNSQLALAAAF